MLQKTLSTQKYIFSTHLSSETRLRVTGHAFISCLRQTCSVQAPNKNPFCQFGVSSSTMSHRIGWSHQMFLEYRNSPPSFENSGAAVAGFEMVALCNQVGGEVARSLLASGQIDQHTAFKARLRASQYMKL